LQEVTVHILIYFHDSCLIAASVAVVGRREDRDNVTLVTPIVTVHHELMSSSDSSKAVRVVELLRDVLAEGVAGATGGDAPATAIIGVRPEEIADGALVGHFLDAVELSDLVQGVDRGGETTVETEDLLFDDSGQGQVVEELSENFPDVGVAVLAEALVVETVNLSNLARFVVTAKNSDTVLIANLQANEQSDSFN